MIANTPFALASSKRHENLRTRIQYVGTNTRGRRVQASRKPSLPHAVPVGPPSRHARLPGPSHARHASARRSRYHLSGRRHHRRVAAARRLVLAAGAQRRRAEAPAQGAAWRAHGVRARQPRRVRAPVLRPDLRRHRDRASRRSTSPPTASAIWSCTATSSTWWSATRSGSRISATGPTRLALFVNTHFNAARRRWACPTGRFPPGRSSRSRMRSISSVRSSRSSPAKPGGAASTAWSAATSITPIIRDIDGVTYINTGDFVEILLARGRAFRRPVRGDALAGRAGGVRERRQHAVRGRAARDRGGSGIMRILIATDAWRPQVNGVVSTLERMTQAARRVRREFRVPHASGNVDRADADLSGHPRRGHDALADQPPHRRGRRRITSTSQPKARSAGSPAAIA